MVRSLLSSRIATLAIIFFGLAAASAPAQEQACETPDASGSCPSSAAATALDDEFGEGLSLLMTGVGATAKQSREGDAAMPAGGHGGALGSKCNEQYYQGLCYRTCTDMGEMEPRKSASNCGGVNDYSFIQRCNEDGTSSGGSGSAPGISGRPMGGCFGDASAMEPSPEAPNLCTMDCKKGAPSAKNGKSKFCCADGKSTPQAYVVDDSLTCVCSLGIKPPFKWMPEPSGVLEMPAKTPCNTGCNDAKAWLMSDGIAYCCPGNKKPTVNSVFGKGDFKVQCSCPP